MLGDMNLSAEWETGSGSEEEEVGSEETGSDSEEEGSDFGEGIESASDDYSSQSGEAELAQVRCPI